MKNWMPIATTVYPDAITWEMLEIITEDAELLMDTINYITTFDLFSEEQEKALRDRVLNDWELGLLRISGVKAFLRFVNWTDIIYALVKTYEPQFFPNQHAL